MPQLLCRLDDVGWFTPTVMSMIDAAKTLPYDEEFRREFSLTLQQQLKALGTPGRVIQTRSVSSSTLYVVQPGGGTEHLESAPPVTATDIAQRLPRLQEELGLEAVGIVPEIAGRRDLAGILVRMPEHAPWRISQVLEMQAYQDQEANTAIAIGLGIDQQPVALDLAELPHLLVAGPHDEAGALMQALLLNLLLFNTPEELRFALIGLGQDQRDTALDPFSASPHVLGKRVRSRDEGLRLLEGLVKECSRRMRMFSENDAVDLETYNSRMRLQPDKTLPRIVAVMDDFVSAGWMGLQERWAELILRLQSQGGVVGVHLMLAAYLPDDQPLHDSLREGFTCRVLMPRPEDARDLWRRTVPLPAAFIDGFVEIAGQTAVPVAFAKVSEQEIARTVGYWREHMAQRDEERRVANEVKIEDVVSLVPRTGVQTVRRRTPGPLQPSAEALVRATDALTPDQVRLSRAHALAAYLGWLSLGPLRDVLGMSEDDARRIVSELQAHGLLEEGTGPIWRFSRLEAPLP